MTLYDQIQLGESKTLELKQQLPRHEQIVQTAIAFANTAGGKLVLGVDDQRNVIGIAEENIFTLQDQITAIIMDRCYPPLLPEIYITNIDGKLVLVVEIFRGNLMPYYLKAAGKNEGTYIRVGATNRKASLTHIVELERQRVNRSFDEEIDTEFSLDTLDLSSLKIHFSAYGKPLDEQKLINLKLVQEEQGLLFPTHGLTILLGLKEHVAVKCARFKGNDMSVFVDRKEYQGDLLTQLANTEAFIKNHIHLHGEIRGLQRTDTYELPEAALREALINAFIHRDYTNYGRDIKVGVYDDIVNIVSPGGFPNTLTLQSIREGRSEIRNRVIARVFKELGYIEQWGSGLGRIKNICLATGLKAPRIEEQGDFVDVEFYRPQKLSAPSDTAAIPSDTAAIPSDTAAIPSDTAVIPPDKRRNSETEVEPELAIRHYLHQHTTITVRDVMALFSIKESRAREILRNYVVKGILEKRGSARNTHYTLASPAIQ
ncbi:RNA-binding domain-containing protein [Chrysiogenes arsenatis]|uniref:RNA-binding domain-containing protein n=1 Tax=Chrysiogenes arsenatis TaxID=309797 RepID=UPI0004023A79|nr:RNA-binding domain-containing protein [Chrysiogenes arsenatis]